MKTLAARIQYQGGNQLERIKQQKRKSFQQALTNDYNTRFIKTPLKACFPCLINENNLKPDYDKKILSVDFDARLEAGDTFEILDDETHWMVYLPILTETAYLRAEIIRCRYSLEVNGKEYWIYFQGPTETDLRWLMRRGISVNELNLSGTIYIKNDENTKEYFERFRHLKIEGHTWEVQVTDSVTVPGILELEIQEYYDNSIEELPEVLVNPDISVDPAVPIEGKAIVKQDSIVGYKVSKEVYSKDGKWEVRNNPRVRVEEVLEDGYICKVRVYPGAIKTFELWYNDKEHITAKIDWEKSAIEGPQIIYPYDEIVYSIGVPAIFSTDSDLVEITRLSEYSCKVFVKTGKKGRFVLKAEKEDGSEESIHIDIKSL